MPNNYIEDYIKSIDEGKQDSNFYFNACRELVKENNLIMREYNRYFNSMESIKNNIIGEYLYLSLFSNYIVIPIAMLLRIKDKNAYYEFIDGKSFYIIKELIRDNQFFYKIGRRIIKEKNDLIINKIYSMQIPDEQKKTMEYEEIIKNLEKIYKMLLTKEKVDEEQWEYNNMLKQILDIISLFC